MTFAVAVALFAWLGHLLDDRLGTDPLFLIVGAMLGVLGGFVHVVHELAPDLLPFRKRGKQPPPGESPPEDAGEEPPPRIEE